MYVRIQSVVYLKYRLIRTILLNAHSYYHFYKSICIYLCRFREGDDADFQDIPSLREHREKLLKEGRLNEGEKTKFTTFMKHAFDDLKTDAVDGFLDLKDNALGLVQKVQHVVETGSLSTPTRRSTSGSGRAGSSTGAGGGRVSSKPAAWGEEDLEEGGGGGGQEESHALFFKRHKIKVSPNVLAEQQLEHEAMALLPTPGAYTRLSPIDEREDEEESKSHRTTVINPLLKASSVTTTATPAKPTLQRESSAEALIFGSSTGSSSGGTVQTGVGSGGASSSVQAAAHDEATAADTSSADKDKKL